MNAEKLPDLQPLKLDKEGFLSALKGFAAIMPNSLLEQWKQSYVEQEMFEEAAIVRDELKKQRNVPERIYPNFDR